MKVEVLIPYRESTAERKANAARVMTYMADALDFRVRFVDDAGHPFSRAGSINHGVRTSDADIIVAADADVLVPSGQLRLAVELAESNGVVLPFDEFLYLSRKSTAKVVGSSGWPSSYATNWRTRPTGKVQLLGGLNVFNRATWEATGGLLELRGWGCQDLIWDAMCATFVAPARRVGGPLLHLWHPHDDNTRRPREENPELAERSRVMGVLLRLRGDRAAMGAELERLGHALPTSV